MERIIEAGAYSSRVELESKLQQMPAFVSNVVLCEGTIENNIMLSGVLPPIIHSKLKEVRELENTIFVRHMPLHLATKYSSSANLSFQALDELLRKDNGLHVSIAREYEVLSHDYAYKQYSRSDCGVPDMAARSGYVLMSKAGVIDTSYLGITATARCEGQDFRKLLLEASIKGPMADEQSPLAKMIAGYWSNHSLSIITNIIRDSLVDDEKHHGYRTIKFVRGAIRTEILGEMLKGIAEEFKQRYKHPLEIAIVED
ncbi:hypothetical protein JXB28_01605 [Candidatus Woesearchaeota archaeon]|nr:hypothetical protein [Candidatus Woesearchaeota archaeon]